ncbi:hypothetical protein M3661_25120 [Paenibacillus sp. MER 180]|uniref:hypothetical protein n=1 Tax=unclassified Paenibacillus TaxID=185978 RepID=UPI001586A523|nr:MULTISPECIES: hypothetical protein [unclassified Paenibacillus]MCM3293390.1 hypothetical protein [Paenibacillus sp. MER 180]
MNVIDKYLRDCEEIFNEIEKLPLPLNDEDYYLLIKRGYEYLVMLHDGALSRELSSIDVSVVRQHATRRQG